MEYLDFPAVDLERLEILSAARLPFDWKNFTKEEKISFVRGMERGYYQGLRRQSQDIIDRFAIQIVGLKP